MSESIKELIQWQREYFQILDSTFRSVTGKSAESFASIDDFKSAVRANAESIAKQFFPAMQKLERDLKDFYVRTSDRIYSIAASLHGSKLILGGGSRFLMPHLKSVIVNSLYADSILIPDPIMPWMEVDRKEEKYSNVQLLEAIHMILFLKPFVDADVYNPSVVIFPSWEKIEEENPQTANLIAKFVGGLFSEFKDGGIESMEDLFKTAQDDGQRLLEFVDSKRILIGPGEESPTTLRKSFDLYEAQMKIFRSEDWHKNFALLTTAQKVMVAIVESYTPQFHLLANTIEFQANPLLCIKEQSYCFEVISESSIRDMESKKALSSQTSSAVRVLKESPLIWLSNINIASLAELKANGNIADFRSRLNKIIGDLETSEVNQYDKIASNFSLELRAMIANHNRELSTLQEKYNRSHSQSLFILTAGLLLNFVPVLGVPLTATTALASIAKFGKEKADELGERRILQSSLVGVLTRAAK